MQIDFTNIHDVAFLLDEDKAVRMLRKSHAPLIVAFLWSAFKAQHRATYGSQELTARLTDFLFAVNEEDPRYPRPARHYLESWTEDGFLRQYYTDEAEEATFELSPAAERALLWITELDQRDFVGAESRLLQVFGLLRELALGTSEDIAIRRAQLEKRQTEIAAEIAALDEGEINRLDATRIRERYFLIEETATKLLSDFRQIEENFRTLNQQAREDQINRQGSRGEILDNIFDAQDSILQTDQGKTFDAFWSFLMDGQRQDELNRHIEQLFEQPELKGFAAESLLPRLKMSLVTAGDRVNTTTDRLIEQLRRFLQSRTFLESKRTAQIIAEIEQLALQVKDEPPPGRYFATIPGKPKVHLLMDRPLFQPPTMLKLTDTQIATGTADDIDIDGLYDQLYIDPAELKGRVQVLLRGRDQISLREVTEQIPLDKGLNELIAYFSLATQWERQQKAVIHPERRDTIIYSKAGKDYRIDLPETIFLA